MPAAEPRRFGWLPLRHPSLHRNESSHTFPCRRCPAPSQPWCRRSPGGSLDSSRGRETWRRPAIHQPPSRQRGHRDSHGANLDGSRSRGIGSPMLCRCVREQPSKAIAHRAATQRCPNCRRPLQPHRELADPGEGSSYPAALTAASISSNGGKTPGSSLTQE